MTSVIFGSTRKIVVLVLLSCFVLGGCSILPSNHRSPIKSDLGRQEQALNQDLSCPDDLALFSLWIFHNSSLDMDFGGGETFHLEFMNQEPSFVDVQIDGDGIVSNEDILREISIDYQGTATHPNSNDCPVQTFEGTWKMKVTINGTCQNDRVKIHVKEEWIDPVLVSDCTGPISPGEGLYSAPELDLVFNLKDEIPSDSLEIQAGGPFQASYVYYLWPAGYQVPLVPLVPEK